MLITLSVILFFLVLRLVVSLFNFVSDPKLRRVNRQYPDLVSILIPARNEEQNIAELLWSIDQQDHEHYEVIILDDNSTDRTFEICQAFAAEHPKFRVIKGEPLPPDWLGKNHACHQLAQKANGAFLLFLDADTRIQPGLINSLLHRMYLKKLGLLSIFPNQEMRTRGQQLVVPLIHYLLLNLLPLQLVYLIKHKAFATASGQCMLFNAEAYRHRQWHSRVKQKVVEDVEIMRQVKADGFNGEVLLANQLISCHNFKSYPEALNGLSRDLLAIFNYNVLSLLIFIIILIGGPMIVIATLNLNLIAFMCGLIILDRIMTSLLAGQSAWKNVLLHPLQMLNLTLVAFLSVQRYLTRSNLWKGRRV